MEFSNVEILQALQTALYRQIPWHKRPAIFTMLRSQGLIQTIEQKAPPSTKFQPALKIAVLTEKGRQEIARISQAVVEVGCQV